MTGQLQNKRVFITGCASGMGRAIALAFAKEGARLAIHGRTRESVRDLFEEIEAAGGDSRVVAADLADNSSIRGLCDDVVDTLNGVDVVVNNAGAVSKAGLLETSEANWDEMMQVNLKTPFLISQQLLPVMKQNKQGGRLIFNSSIAAKLPDPMGSAYNASKSGVLGLVRCLAAELGEFGITVNAICPGWVDTPMAERLHMQMHEDKAESDFEEFYDSSIRSNMLGARITPDSVADFAVFLASDGSRHITGQAINVCAGVSLS